MLTPINAHGQIDLPAVEKLFDFTLQSGNFPFVLGTTGEMASVSYTNREILVKQAVKCVEGKSILYVGIADNCVENTISASKKYADWGADVFVVHLPSFLPIGPDLMLKYFETVADNSPAPVMIYNIVSITRMSIPIDVIESLSHHPNIVGLKDSERDFERIQALATIFKDREDFALSIGWTDKSSEAISLGFDGIIPNTANVIPGLFQSLYKAASRGDDAVAGQLQAKAHQLGKLVQANKTMTRTIPELKAILHHLKICQPFVLPPIEMIEAQEADELVKNFTELNL